MGEMGLPGDAMKKRFRGKKCAYCCEQMGTTEDHVFATGFFHHADRDNKALPKAPACLQCNNKKSKLDEYAMTVLAFGGRHASALPFIESVGMKRVQNNRALHQKIQAGAKSVWVNEPSGLIMPSSTFPVEGGPLTELFQYIAKGLIWHHWGAYLDGDDSVRVIFLTEEGDREFRQSFKVQPQYLIQENLRNGTVQYEGLHDPGDPHFSGWRIMMYGGVHIASTYPSLGICRVIGIITKRLSVSAETANVQN